MPRAPRCHGQAAQFDRAVLGPDPIADARRGVYELGERLGVGQGAFRRVHGNARRVRRWGGGGIFLATFVTPPPNYKLNYLFGCVVPSALLSLRQPVHMQ